MTEVSARIKKILKTYSSKVSISAKELESKFLEVLAKERETFKDIPEKELEDRCLLILRGAYTGRSRSKASIQQGFFVGDTFARDRNGFLRRKAIDAKNRNFTEAKMLGLINDAGEVLDNRPTVTVFGKEGKNPNYNKPLQEDWSRRIYGIFKHNNSWVFGMLNLRGERARNTMVEYLTPCKFLAMDRGTKNGYLTMNQSRFTEFQEINTDWNIHDIVMSIFQDEILPIETEKLKEEYEATRDAWDAYTIVLGTVGEPIIRAKNTTLIFLSSPDPEVWTENPLTCFLPLEWDIDFTEYSKVLAIGKLGQSNRQAPGQEEEEEGPKTVMRIYGIYTMPGQARVRTDVKKIDPKAIKFAWKKI